jgi:HSP20 family protein
MREIIDLKARINQLFEELMARTQPGEQMAMSGEWTPRVDLYELPDRVVLRADVPGVAAEDLDVRMEGGHLILRGARRQPQDLDPSAICRLERPFGTFIRRYALPESVSPDGVKASAQNGVLEVVLRKRETAAARRIAVAAE